MAIAPSARFLPRALAQSHGKLTLHRRQVLLSSLSLTSQANLSHHIQQQSAATKGPGVSVQFSTEYLRRATAMASAAGAGAAEEVKKVLVAVADGTEEMEAVIAIDVLRRAGADVTVASVEPQLQVTASRKVNLVADKLISDCKAESYDLIVLPGGMPGAEKLRDSDTLKAMVENQASGKKEVAAICAAPVVALSTWGILDGRKATAHPAFSDRLADTSSVATRVVEDGNITTSRGPGTAFEFSLKLVERLFGKEKAAAVAAPMVMPSPAADDRWRLETGAGLSSTKNTAKVLVPIAEGSEEMEAIIVIDVLRRAGADVVVASVEDSLEIVASRKVKIVADVSIADAAKDTYDLIVLPGGMPGAERLRDCAVLDSLLKAQASAGLPYAAICAAPVVTLQSKGLLDGKKATAHPAFSDKLPDQDAVKARVVRDSLVVTSRGPGTAFEFALALVELIFGPEKEQSVAQPMVMAVTSKVAAA